MTSWTPIPRSRLRTNNTDEAIKRAQNYMQLQDNDGEKHVAFSSASDESNDDEEVKALRASLKEKDQRLSALETKFDSFSNEQKDCSNKPRSRRGRMKKNAATAQRLASGSKDTKNPNAITRKRMKQRQRFKPSRRGLSAQARDAKRLRVRRKTSRLVRLLIKDQTQGGGW